MIRQNIMVIYECEFEIVKHKCKHFVLHIQTKYYAS